MRRLLATYSALMVFVLLVAVVLRYWDPSPSQQARTIAFDTYQRLSPRAYDPSLPVRIIDIDEPSLKARGQWPWPRTDIATIVKRLNELGAAAVVFDMVFPEADSLSPEQIIKRLLSDPVVADATKLLQGRKPNDQILAEALSGGSVVLGFVGVPAGGVVVPPRPAEIEHRGDDPALFVPAFAGAVVNLPELSANAAGSGAINWIADFDQVIRKLPLIVRVGDDLYPSITAEGLRVAQAISNYRIVSSGAALERSFGTRTGVSKVLIGSATVPTDAEGQIWLRFTHSEPSRYISAVKLFDGTAKAEAIKGHIVLVGTSAAGLLDVRATPLDPAIPGVEIHAQAMEQILSGDYLTRPDFATGGEVIFTSVAGALLALAVYRTGAGIGAVVGGVTVTCVLAMSWVAYRQLGWLVDPMFPILTLSGMYVTGTTHLRVATERERNLGREKLRRIAQEMESAAQIQRSFLPHEPLSGTGTERFDVFATMLPAKDVGGDFFDYFLVDENRLGVAVGDVSGKGVPAALFMSVSRTVLRTIAFEGELPGKVLARVNEILTRDNSQSMFVTIFYALINLQSGELHFASAGHDNSILLTASGGGENLGVMGPAIGLFDFGKFRTGTRKLSSGDTLLLVTDGITEAFDTNGRAYGLERLATILKARPFSSASDLVAAIVGDVARFSDGAEQSDDITCVAMRYLGQPVSNNPA